MLGKRIRQARIAAGLTQDEVVRRLATRSVSLTKAGFSKYERGGSEPKASLLRELAWALDVRVDYFFREPQVEVQWLAFRKAAVMGQRRQEQLKTLAREHVEALVELIDRLVPDRRHSAPDPMTVETGEDVEFAAEKLRKSWGLGEQPIDSVTDTIESNGGVVVKAAYDDEFDGLSGWANGKIPVTIVSATVSDDRRRFSLAHELGHLFMACKKATDKEEEHLAHRFAGAFLVPRQTAIRELGERRRRLNFQELGVLKLKHGLSMQAWIYRAADLNIIDDAHKRTLFTQFSERGWRRKEPVDFEGREEPKQLKQLTAHAYAEGILTQEQAEELCPGVTHDPDAEVVQVPESLDARTLMRLPKHDRDRILKMAATLVEDEYSDGGGLSGFESLAEEDHRDDAVGS